MTVADLRPTVHGLVRAAVSLDVDTVAGTVRASIADNGVAWTWNWLINPVWTSLERGHADIAERLFSQVVSQVLITGRRLSDHSAAPVLLACADEEYHWLPLEALAAGLAEAGIGSCVLGARVPPHALATAAGRLRPAVAIVWSQARATADPAQVVSLRAACPELALIPAGPGWDRRTLPTDAAPSDDVIAALELTRELLG